MLDPYNRRLLKETLRPPEGFTLDCAVATTYSLDLLALLTASAAFGIFDLEAEDGEVEPLALLGALRRHAKDIYVFHQADRILLPKRADRLFINMEKMLFPVRAEGPQNSFHPKIWVLKYRNDEELFFRFLCCTRNLTFDRSWDLFLVLDGNIKERKSNLTKNELLADFVGALPNMALRKVPKPVADRIANLRDDLRKVIWESPKGFESVAFLPMGMGKGDKWPFAGKARRMLIVSPFLEERLLSRLVAPKGRHVLISRVESLDAVPEDTLARFSSVFTVDPLAQLELSDNGSPEALSGLHAKLYAEEMENEVRLMVGSGNATNAAFHGNTEFFVELRGPKRICGVDAILGTDAGAKGATNLLGILEPYVRRKTEEEDDTQREIKDLINNARWVLSGMECTGKISPPDDAQRYGFCLSIQPEHVISLPKGVKVHSWPVTLSEKSAVPLVMKGPVLADFGKCSLEVLTGFFAFRVSVAVGDRRETVRFVLSLPLEGVPDDREERMLKSFFRDKAQLVHFLWLILELSGTSNSGVPPEFLALKSGQSLPADSWAGQGLLEQLLRVLDRDPDRLKDVAKLIEDLGQRDSDEDLLPDNFEAIWQPVWKAYQELMK